MSTRRQREYENEEQERALKRAKIELANIVDLPLETINEIIDTSSSIDIIFSFTQINNKMKEKMNKLLNSLYFWKCLILRDFYDLPWCIEHPNEPFPDFMRDNSIGETLIYKNCYMWYRVFFNFIRKSIDLKTYFTPDDKYKEIDEDNFGSYNQLIVPDILYLNNIQSQATSNYTKTDLKNKYTKQYIASENNLRTIEHLNFYSIMDYKTRVPIYFFENSIYENGNFVNKDTKNIPKLMICLEMPLSRDYIKKLDNFRFLDIYRTKTELTIIHKSKKISKENKFKIESKDLIELKKEIINKINTEDLITLITFEEQSEVNIVIGKLDQLKIIEQVYGKELKWNMKKNTNIKEEYNKQPFSVLEYPNTLNPYSFFIPKNYLIQIDSIYSTRNKLKLSKNKKEIKIYTFITTIEKYESVLSKESDPVMENHILKSLEKRISFPIENTKGEDLLILTCLEHSIWTFVEDILLLTQLGQIQLNLGSVEMAKRRIFNETEKYPKELNNYIKGDHSLFFILFSHYLSTYFDLFNLYDIDDKLEKLQDILFILQIESTGKDNLDIINCLKKVMSMEPTVRDINQLNQTYTTIPFFGNKI